MGGGSEKSSVSYALVDYTGPVALILGAEDKGISNDLLKLCDEFVSIPEFGNINSLNVSVAGGVMMYEVVRQRLNDNQNSSIWEAKNFNKRIVLRNFA